MSTFTPIGRLAKEASASLFEISTNASASDVSVRITHEYPIDSRGSKYEHRSVVEPSENPTFILFRSEVKGSPGHNPRSPAYIAAIRRRLSSDIIDAIQTLESNSCRADFATCTFPISEKLRDAINIVLIDWESEGYAREIMRRVRDSFLDGGWENYKDTGTRNSAIRALRSLATEEVISSEHLKNCSELGNVAGGLIFDSFESDGDEELN